LAGLFFVRACPATIRPLADGSTLAMRGVPLPVIAKQLGRADTRMTEKHYAHLSPNYIADTIRANFPKFGILEKDPPPGRWITY